MTKFTALCRTAAVLCLMAGGGAAQQSVSLSADEMRGFASQLLSDGDAPRALAVTEALLTRNPNDIGALLVRAQAAIAIAEFDLAIDAASAAYGAATQDQPKFISARLAALAYAEMERDTLAQIWLRRARQFAPSDDLAEDVAEDYRFLRRRNPWSTRLHFGLTPSANVNNGSENSSTQAFDADFQTLYALYVYGIYDPETHTYAIGNNQQALSGVEVSAGVQSQYRLRQSRDDITFLNIAANVRTAILSDAAKTASPTSRGNDFAFASLSFGLSHRWITGPDTLPWDASVNLDQTWFGGSPYATALRGSLSTARKLSDTSRLRYGVELKQTRFNDDDPSANLASANLQWIRLLDDDRAINLGLRAAVSTSDNQDSDYRAVTLFGAYDLGQPIEGISATIGGYYEDRYFAETFYGPAERSEQTTSLSINMVFEDIEYYGFSPQITLRGTRSNSNLALFERSDVGVSFDLRSSF